MSSISPLLLTTSLTHQLVNLLIIWNDQPVVIIDQTQLLLTPTTAPNKMLVNKTPKILFIHLVTALERTKKD